MPLAPIWSVMVRFVCPVAVLFVLTWAAVTNSYF
jgi:hypothetical protein